MENKNILVALGALILIGGVAYFMLNSGESVTVDNSPTPSNTDARIDITDTEEADDGANTEENEDVEEERDPVEVIGRSENGKDISVHHFGNGETEVLFVGGIHSSFAPNTVEVAEALIDAIESGDVAVPENLTASVIPNMNPDASGAANTLAGRLNANGVDLNRNFDCDWSAEGTWRSTAVNGGSTAFSEPEAQAIRDYVAGNDIAAAVVYYAADGGVYASNCGGSLDSDIAELTARYADASGYTANKEFDAYAIGGDMTNWLAKENVPAISVLLSNYADTEWSKNKAGIEAVLSFYAE